MGFKLLRVLVFFGALCAVSLFQPTTARAEPESFTKAFVVKVDGDGVARLRRKTGTESVVGEKQEVFAGDKISTDGRSTVELALADGTIVRIGLNSEYRLDSATKKKGFVAWVFNLAKGSIRALVEKSSDKKNVKFRVNTPSGTMGVRGTELVLDHNPRTGITTLFTIEGNVEFGAKACIKNKNCIEVKTGERASIGKGEAKPTEAAPFQSKDLVGLNAEEKNASPAAGSIDENANQQAKGSDKDKGAIEASNRLALFESVKKATGSSTVPSAEDITAMVAQASEKLAESQDSIIGRTKETREAMHKAIADGTYDDYIKIAEDFDDIASKEKKSAAYREEERFSVTKAAKKFALSEKIVGSGKVSAPPKKSAKSIEEVLSSAASKASGGKSSSGSSTLGGTVAEQVAAAKKLLATKQGEYEQAKKESFARENEAKAKERERKAKEEAELAAKELLAKEQLAKEQLAKEQQEKERLAREAETARLAREQREKELLEQAKLLLQDKVISTAYHEYETCPAIIIGSREDNDGLETYKRVFKEGVTTKISREKGICYRTVTKCQKEFQTCDLSEGRACNGRYKQTTLMAETCRDVKEQIECK